MRSTTGLSCSWASSPVSIGGYCRNPDWQYVCPLRAFRPGINSSSGRFSLFVASTITKHIKFLSEIEYENDPTGDPGDASGGEFEVEYAALDIEFHPLLNLRGGVDDRQSYRGVQSKS